MCFFFLLLLDLCLPLMSLVDYRGFRLIAMSILPIEGKKSIIYGSDDYGHHIWKENADLAKLMEQAASIMNIKQVC